MESSPEPKPATTKAQPAAQTAAQARLAARPAAGGPPDGPGAVLGDPYTPRPAEPGPRGFFGRLWDFITGLLGRGRVGA